MGYRRGYRRKDGTYVSGHFIRNNKKGYEPPELDPGCQTALILFLIFIFLLIITCK